MDFVQIGSVGEETTLSSGEGAEVVIKSGPHKPKLEAVSPMQWSAANIRILLEMLTSGSLKQSSMFDYLAYTVKVSELADSYMWSSVLHFDRAYRQLQAQHGFRWGSDSTHLATLHLRPKLAKAPQSQRGSASRTDNPRTTPSPICRLYNRNNCPFGEACKYRHVCSAPGCKGAHPLALHGKGGGPAKNSGDREF